MKSLIDVQIFDQFIIDFWIAGVVLSHDDRCGASWLLQTSPPMMINKNLIRWWLWSDQWWWRSDQIRDVKNSARVCIIRVLFENSPSIRLITRMILEHSRVLGIKTSTRYPVMTMITMITIVRLMRMIMMMTRWWWCIELMAGSRRPALGQRWLLTCYPRVINPHLASALFSF